MKKMISNYRYYVLFVLMTIAIIGIFSVPVDDQPMISWMYCLISSKVIGFGAGYAAHRLTQYWEKRKAIPELTKAINNL